MVDDLSVLQFTTGAKDHGQAIAAAMNAALKGESFFDFEVNAAPCGGSGVVSINHGAGADRDVEAAGMALMILGEQMAVDAARELALRNALKVFATNPAIRAFLEANARNALEQAEAALALPTKAGA